ncbi:MAG: ATPase, T2SS/T4P/T4SS family [Actinomycetota bacterium]
MTTIDRAIVARLRERVGERLNEYVTEAEAAGRPAAAGQDRRMLARKVISEEIEGLSRSLVRRNRAAIPYEEFDELTRAVLAELFELGPLQEYIDDPENTDIAVNGCDVVWLTKRDGRKVRGRPVAESDAALVELIQTAARRGRSEQRWDRGSPTLDMQLPSGDRLNAIAWVSGRPSISIRRHDFGINRLEQLLELGTVTPPLLDLLRAMVAARFNIVIAGGTGAGKTTFMRCLINEVPPRERLVTVEDSLELGLGRFADLHPDMVDLEGRAANVEGVGALTMNDLALNALRMNPGRLVVGEVRGDEALTLLLACTQGNDGAMCTLHADSSEGVFGRLRMYLAMTRERFEPAAANMMTAQALDAIVHVKKVGPGQRAVSSIREVTGSDGEQVISNEVYGPDEYGCAVPTGIPFTQERIARLEAVGFDRRTLDQAFMWEHA